MTMSQEIAKETWLERAIGFVQSLRLCVSARGRVDAIDVLPLLMVVQPLCVVNDRLA